MKAEQKNIAEQSYKLFMSFSPNNRKLIGYTSAGIVLLVLSPKIMRTMAKIILSYKDLTNAIKS